MILFTIILMIIVILTLIIIGFASAFGAGVILIFGDVILCIILLIWFIKKIFFKK